MPVGSGWNKASKVRGVVKRKKLGGVYCLQVSFIDDLIKDLLQVKISEIEAE